MISIFADRAALKNLLAFFAGYIARIDQPGPLKKVPE